MSLSPRRMRSIPVTLALAAATAAPLAAQDDTTGYRPTPLFASNDPLTARLFFDWETVTDDIDSVTRVEHTAILAVDGEDPLGIEVRTRGHFRRQARNCEFPPLRLDVPRSRVEGTLFEGQDKLKLVTHCRNRSEQFEQYVVLEYLAYRMLNLVTDVSFRARLVDITYEDTAGREDTLATVGIILESEEELLARLGGSMIEVGLPPSEIQPDYLALTDVFHYLIGNTDWSIGGPHNVMIVDANYEYYAIPYDFDWTGLVDARYARPDPDLPIRSVRDRLYRGSCHPPERLAATYQRFLEHRDAFYALLDLPQLTDDTRERTARYLDEFFETIGNEGVANRRIANTCRGE